MLFTRKSSFQREFFYKFDSWSLLWLQDKRTLYVEKRIKSYDSNFKWWLRVHPKLSSMSTLTKSVCNQLTPQCRVKFIKWQIGLKHKWGNVAILHCPYVTKEKPPITHRGQGGCKECFWKSPSKDHLCASLSWNAQFPRKKTVHSPHGHCPNIPYAKIRMALNSYPILTSVLVFFYYSECVCVWGEGGVGPIA